MLTLECLHIIENNILFSANSETTSRSHTTINIAKLFEKIRSNNPMMLLKLHLDASSRSDPKRYFYMKLHFKNICYLHVWKKI